LSRTPEVLLPNGLDIAKFPNFEEIVLQHRLQREKIREFILYYFFPYYQFDLENTLFYFTACRYEFFNKGIDIFIKSLGELNRQLKAHRSPKTIIVFFWIPSGVKQIDPALFEAKNNYIDIKDSMKAHSGEIEGSFIYGLLSGKKEKDGGLAGPENIIKEVKPKILKFKNEGLPSLSTHILSDPNDLIIKSFRAEGLENKKDDRVKVIFYPAYLTGSDGLLDLTCYEGIQGSHLGVFPSFYEPWGYTTLETAALGVAAITTDCSGLGRFFMEQKKKKRYPGIFILKRVRKQEAEAVKQLSQLLFDFSQLSREERIKNKMAAYESAALCDWKILAEQYIKSHNLAIKRIQ
jgi:glycogen(starch) synthase